MMKKLLLFLITSFVLTSVASAQNGWINYKIDNKLRAKLPAEPTKADEYSVMSKTADTVILMITVVDFQKVAGVDSAMIASSATSDDFIGGIKNGIVGQLPGFTLGDIKQSTWNGYYCYNLDGFSTEKKLKVYFFMVIIGKNMYSLAAILPNGKQAKSKDDFFASLALN